MGEGRFTLSGIALVLGAIALGLMFSPNADVAAFGNILTFLTIILLILSLISRNNSSVSLILAIILCVVNLFKYDNYKTQHAELLRAIEEANLKKYTISFDTDGGSEINPMVVSANTYLENNNIPEKAGYVFECWTLNGSVFDFSGKVDNRITSDITLKANYSIDLSNPNITVTTESHGSTESGLINNNKNKDNSQKSSKNNTNGLGSTIKFDGFELTFDTTYSFATIENQFSEHNGASVIKLGVNVKNVSNETKSLNMFFCKFFGANGIELDGVGAYFSGDDVLWAGDLRPGASYKKYFHILYDGNGKYSIDFDNYSQKKSVDFNVSK